jgi:hypothetical protein
MLGRHACAASDFRPPRNARRSAVRPVFFAANCKIRVIRVP